MPLATALLPAGYRARGKHVAADGRREGMVRVDGGGVHVDGAVAEGQGWGFGPMQQPQGGLLAVIFGCVGCPSVYLYDMRMRGTRRESVEKHLHFV